MPVRKGKGHLPLGDVYLVGNAVLTTETLAIPVLGFPN